MVNNQYLNIAMISILVLLLLGVVNSRHISYYDNDSDNEPIITKAQERRICAELCMAGLGGEPCGEDCSDVIPQGLPTYSQSQSEYTSEQNNLTRQDACPLLCANRLGFPLCGCNYTPPTTPFFKVNFLQICWHFCNQYNYRIYGCGECSDYKTMSDQDKEAIMSISARVPKRTYDWNKWCVAMCHEGDGGSACYCDLLPLTLKI